MAKFNMEHKNCPSPTGKSSSKQKIVVMNLLGRAKRKTSLSNPAFAEQLEVLAPPG
jgi:hypothetical protein